MTNQNHLQLSFDKIVELIQAARQRALHAVNTTLIDLYWQIGRHICLCIAEDGWGKSTVAALATHIAQQYPGLRGFSPQNLWRMRQFYETYRDASELSTLLRELPWSAHLHILSKTKHPEEREFYLRMATRNGWHVLLCADKDSEVVEYALSRSLSPTLIAEYQTCLPDKKLLQSKLHEFYQLLQQPERSNEESPVE